MTPRSDFYKTLQVDQEAEAEIIAVAYKRLAAKYHPDVNPAPDSGRRMRDLNAAFEVLSDPQRRAAYDSQRQPAPGRARRSTSRQSPAPASPGATEAMLVVAPRSLSFGKVIKGASPTAKLEVGVTENRTLIGEVRGSHPWIHLSVNRLFSDRTTVHVTIDTASLDEGRHYSGAVIIDSVVFGLRSVPVALSVAASVKPALRVSPTFLDFGEIRFGQSPKVIELVIANTGTGYLSGSLRPQQSWLSVSQAAFAGDPAHVQVMACADGLVPGRTYTGEIDIDSTGGKGLLVARLDVAGDLPADSAPRRVPSRDLLFLEQRLDILKGQAQLSSEQKQERNIIEYLLRTCHGGDVTDMLQRGVATAQGTEGIGWRDEAGVLQGTSQAVAILGGLLERLRRWESTEV
jgi:curved DNA-binding protein CbpA